MSISIQVHPAMPARPCRWCLSLQDNSVFADFDMDSRGQVFLRRISFDGYGCCHLPEDSQRMDSDDSRMLAALIDRGAIDDPRIQGILRTYFQQTADVIWRDALAAYELL